MTICQLSEDTEAGGFQQREEHIQMSCEITQNKDADLLENGLEDMGRGKGKLGQSETVAWTYIHYQT